MSKKEKICNAIRKSIYLGIVNPGEHLTETDLSKQYGASRGTVREALSQLSNEGFITITPNKGATVVKPSPQDLIDHFQLMALLERKAVEWTTHTVSVSDIEELIQINNDLRNIAKSKTEGRANLYEEKNLKFHMFFWEKCGNSKLAEIVKEIRLKIFRYRSMGLLMFGAFDEYIDDHDAIINALVQKKSEIAGQVMEDHILKALSNLRLIFSNLFGNE